MYLLEDKESTNDLFLQFQEGSWYLMQSKSEENKLTETKTKIINKKVIGEPKNKNISVRIG